MVDLKNWRDVDWTPINALTGGSTQFRTGLGLKPWYVKGHARPQGPGEVLSDFKPSAFNIRAWQETLYKALQLTQECVPAMTFNTQ